MVLQLAKMESLAVYFDTDATSLAGLSYEEFVEKFRELVRERVLYTGINAKYRL
jgi:vacuolar protein sorting-associated protein 13A/C